VNTPLAQQLALSTFTPSTMSQETLEGMFVQREQLLQSIVQDLAASVDSAKQYLMLVGARGMGKTHFVSLVYHRLKQKPELHDRLLIAWLREEEYGVNSWLYLIIEILRSIGQEGIDTAEQVNKLADLSISEAEYLANRVLTEVIGDRTLLIITENIDKLLYGLGDKEQWKFRAFLQETNCCSILATTPKISEDTSKKEKPFFGFFTSIHLPTFSHTDAVAMLIKIANLSGNTQLAKFLNTDEGKSRVRALHHLAGGNPRVYALFAQLITEDTLEALLPAVIEMLDKLTPYYQSRVESLGQSDDQQKIVMYLARETRAVTVKKITSQCFISSERTTSNALGKLTQKGFVIVTRKGREAYYEISEVLMRLCLEMKNARNGDIKLCVDFLRIWFRPHERQEYLEQLEADGKLEHAKYFRLSLANANLDPILLACKRDLQQSIDGGDIDTALQVWRELVCVNQIGEAEERRIVELINSGDSAETIAAIEDLLEGESAEELYIKGLLLYESKKWEEALKMFEIFLNLNPAKSETWFKRGVALYELGRYEEAIDNYNRAIQINSIYIDAWNNTGITLHCLGRHEEAIATFDRALQINPGYDNAWNGRGIVLDNLDRYEEAIDSYERAIKINPGNSNVWYNRGIALDKLGRHEEAIDSFDRALQINPGHDNAWNGRGIVLDNLDRYEEAIDSFNRAIKINPDNNNAWNNRGVTLDNAGRYEEAIDSLERALQINCDDDDAWYNQGVTLSNLGRYEEAISSLDRALQIKPDYDNALYNRNIALVNLVRNLHDRGLADFKNDNYADALVLWQKVFKNIQQEQLSNASDLIQSFLDEQLLPKFQQPAVRDILPQILTIYTTAQVLPELGVALTRNLKAIQSPTISDYTATEWLKMWQELGKPHPELALALRMLEAGIKYKQNPTDDRVFLRLPQEMRPLLREALGLEP
jgi:tetratricopeptide (TPR) repeat protein